MSIADKISRLNTAKGNIATAITAKGGTVSEGDGFESFASDIATIPSGITPTGTINITTNGTHDVTNYASANVNVSRGSGWQRPVEWGEYPLEFQQEKAKPNAERTMEAIYLLYHHDEEKYGDIASFASFKCTITGGYKVERGHMVGSTFTVDATTSVNSATFYTETFTVSMPEYILYRITPTTSGNAFSGFVFGHTNTTLNGLTQIVLEVYGRTHISRIGGLVSGKPIHIDNLAYGTRADLSNYFTQQGKVQSIDCNDWDLSGTTTLQGLFSYCYSLQSADLSDWNVGSSTTFSSVFLNCGSLTNLNLSGWNASNVTTVSNMFQYCYSLANLNLSGWNVSSLLYMINTFNSCVSLASLNLSDWNIGSLLKMNYTFQTCTSIRKINLSGWNVTNVTEAINLFYDCSALSTLDCTGWDLSSLTNASNMFYGCRSLIDFISPKFYVSVSFSACTKLSYDSLMSIINNLATVSTTQTLTLGATNRAKLTTEEIAIATEKGWTVA